jgi:hypothetical protein
LIIIDYKDFHSWCLAKILHISCVDQYVRTFSRQVSPHSCSLDTGRGEDA